MPFVNDPNLEDDEQQKQNGSAPTLPGSSGAASSAPGVSVGHTGPTSSGNFTNLGSYLNANAGQDFGSQLAGKVQGDVNTADQDQSNAQSQFQSRVDQNTTQYDPNVISQASANPTQFASNPNNVSAFQAQLNASYGGPQTFQDAGDIYNQTQGATQKAQQEAQASQTEGGRFALLNQYYGRPDYNQGEQTLDNLLVQNDSTAQPAFQQAQQGADQASSNFNSLQNNLNAYATQAQANAGNTQAAARSALGIDSSGNLATGGLYGQYQSDLNNQFTSDQAKQSFDLASMTNRLGQAEANNNATLLNKYDSTQLAPEYEKNSATQAPGQGYYGGGLTPTGTGYSPSALGPGQLSNYLFGVDPSQYIQQENAPTLQSVVTQSDLDRLNALNTLAGNQVITPGLVGNYDPSKDVTFNSQGFDQARTVNKNVLDTGTQALLNQEQHQAGVGPGQPFNPGQGFGTAPDNSNILNQIAQLYQKYGIAAPTPSATPILSSNIGTRS